MKANPFPGIRYFQKDGKVYLSLLDYMRKQGIKNADKLIEGVDKSQVVQITEDGVTTDYALMDKVAKLAKGLIPEELGSFDQTLKSLLNVPKPDKE